MQLDRLRQSAIARPAAFLALCVLAPLAIYAGFNAWTALDRRQAGLTQQSIAGVQALVENVDRQLATNLEDAETLAGAPALDPVGGRYANLPVFEGRRNAEHAQQRARKRAAAADDAAAQ